MEAGIRHYDMRVNLSLEWSPLAYIIYDIHIAIPLTCCPVCIYSITGTEHICNRHTNNERLAFVRYQIKMCLRAPIYRTVDIINKYMYICFKVVVGFRLGKAVIIA